MAKTKQVSFNSLKKIIQCQSLDNKTSLLFDVGDNENIEVEVTKLLSTQDSVDFVESVSNAVFIDGVYTPSLYNLVYSKAILAFYTNIKVNDINSDLLNEIVYNTDIMDKIIDVINEIQMYHLESAITNAINHRCKELLSVNESATNHLIQEVSEKSKEQSEQVKTLIETFSEIGKAFDGIDQNKLMEMLETISNKDEDKIVNSVMDYREKFQSSDLDAM